MAKFENRISNLEKEALFWRWFYFSRFLEGLSEEQIEEVALHWRFPDPLPEPLPWGMSELDKLDRKSLMRRCEESERETSRIMRETAEHSEDEYKFYLRHGHAARGLETVQHLGPSSIAIDTICRSKGQIPESFLRGCGVPDDFITFMKSLSANPIDFYSCFISYSFADQDFAERLHSDLQNKGVRCWFAPHDMQSGKKLHEQIDQAIRLHDKLLLILSPHSMESEWVKTEIAKAREREVRESRRVLFPIRLAPFETLREWEYFDADSGKDSAREIREYFIPDFSNWKNHDSYQEAFQRLISDLKSLESKVLPKSSGQ
jgi:hypothetical protein